MARFIPLTPATAGGVVFINFALVQSFQLSDSRKATLLHVVSARSDTIWYVRETPEQITAMLARGEADAS